MTTNARNLQWLFVALLLVSLNGCGNMSMDNSWLCFCCGAPIILLGPILIGSWLASKGISPPAWKCAHCGTVVQSPGHPVCPQCGRKWTGQ